MVKLSETELKTLIKGGETNTVELKLAAPRAVELAERLCGMANAKGGMVIIGVEDATRKVVGMPDERIGETMDVILRAARQVIKPELVLDPPVPYQGKTLWEGSEESQPEIVVQDRRAEQVELRLIQALHYVQEQGFITNGIYRQLTGVTDRTAHRDLEKLVERGRLKGTGQRAARRYVLA